MQRAKRFWQSFLESDTRPVDVKKAEAMAEALKNRPEKAIGYWLGGPYNIEPGGKSFAEYGRGICYQIVYMDPRTDLRTIVAQHGNAYLFSEDRQTATRARDGNLYDLPLASWDQLMEHLLLGIIRGRQQQRYDLEEENHELATALFARAGYRTCQSCGEIYHPRRPRSGDGTHCPNECDGEDTDAGEA